MKKKHELELEMHRIKVALEHLSDKKLHLKSMKDKVKKFEKEGIQKVKQKWHAVAKTIHAKTKRKSTLKSKIRTVANKLHSTHSTGRRSRNKELATQ